VKKPASSSPARRMSFNRFGRSYHLRIDTAEDLRGAVELDEAHWVATGAPIETINCDRAFLELVDTDRNGRIMCFELAQAVRWLFKVLRETGGVTTGSDSLAIDAVDTDDEEGARICESARQMLALLGTPDARRITLRQVRRIEARTEAAPVSEAGVVLPAAAEQQEIRRFITEVISTVGGAPHPSGAAGLSREKLDEFLAEARAFLDRQGAGPAPSDRADSGTAPSGPAAEAVGLLGVEKLHAYLDEKFAAAVRSLIAEGAKTALALDGMRRAEKLILYQAFLLGLANNFVGFPHLYDAARRAMFEMGSLIMDGRRFNLAVKAADLARHAELAKTSNMFVMYVELAPAGGGEPTQLAVPVTSGGKGNLCVGKRGLFEDIAGRQWDARVVQIIENPISITEALVSPFKRLGRLLTGKIEAVTTQAEKKLQTTVVRGQAPAAAPGRPGGGLLAGGLLMGGGIAVAALGTAAAFITKTLAGLQWYTIVIGLGCAILAVVLPTSIVAFLKLRRRDLSAILEGSGWAINARMRLTLRQGRLFTQRPQYPRGARGIRRKGCWGVLVLAVIIAAAIAAGYFLVYAAR